MEMRITPVATSPSKILNVPKARLPVKESRPDWKPSVTLWGGTARLRSAMDFSMDFPIKAAE